MNRTILYLLIFVVLAGLGYFFYQNNESSTSLVSSESDFSVEQIDDIQKIFLADRSGKTATLIRQNNNTWQYNKEYKARPQAIENLLKTIRDVEVRYVVPNPAMDLVVSDLASNGIKVEIYLKSDPQNPHKIYYVGGESTDGQGTNMIMEGSDQPYVTHIPLWEGILTPRYLVKEEEWRDKTVFADRFEDITYVSVEYPKQRGFSFILEKTGKTYDIKPFYNTTPVIDKPIKNGAVQQYLIGFSSIIAEAFENDNPNKSDVLLNEVPFAQITMTKENGVTKKVNLYPVDESADQSGTATNPIVNNTIERYFVLYKNGRQEDFMLGQHRNFKKVLWGYEFFF